MVIFTVVWFVLLVTLLAAYFVSISLEVRKMGQIYDGCTSSGVNYKYIIKLNFGRHSRGFPKHKAYVMIDFLDDQKQFITRVAIPPVWMSHRWAGIVKSSGRAKTRAAKFELNRSTSLRDIRYIRISHDCSSPINQFLQIYSLEVKDLMANLVTTVAINRHITDITPDASEEFQVFEAQPPTVAKNEGDLFVEGITPHITLPEYTVFFMFVTNMCMLVTLLTPFFFEPTTFLRILANGVVAPLIALLITVIPIIAYQEGVKKRYAANHGTGAWNYVRWAYLGSVVALALAVGITATVLATSLPSDVPALWVCSMLVSLVILMATIPLIYYLYRCYQKGQIPFWSKRANVEEPKNTMESVQNIPGLQMDIVPSVMSDENVKKPPSPVFKTVKTVKNGKQNLLQPTISQRSPSH